MKLQGTNLVTRIAIFLLIYGIIVFWGFRVSGEEWTEAQIEVWNSLQTHWEYCKQGDLEGFLSLYHDDAIEWWQEKVIPLGKAEMKFNYKHWLVYDKPVSYELEALSIQIFGNVANVFYKAKWKGNRLSSHSRHLETWLKQDNKWKFVSGIEASCEKPPKCN